MAQPSERTQASLDGVEARRRSPSGFVDALVGSTRDRSLRSQLLAAALVVVPMLLVWWLVRATGGTKFVFLHATYIPVTFAALLFGARGGAPAGLAGGVLLGPLTPLDVLAGRAQSVSAWVLRGAFFVICGTSVGSFAGLMRERLERNESLSSTLSETYGATCACSRPSWRSGTSRRAGTASAWPTTRWCSAGGSGCPRPT